MMYDFLKIRIIQLRREVAVLGWWRTVLIFLFLLFACLFVNKQMNESPNCYYLTGFIVLVVGGIHLYRKDKRFLTMTGIARAKIYITEYHFFSLPILIAIALSVHWYCLFILTASYFLFSVCPCRSIMLNGKLRFSFPLILKDNFEWISGFRKNIGSLSFFYLLALALLCYPYASLYALWILLGIVGTFYRECESFIMLNLSERSPRQFIIGKLKLHLLTYFIISLPIIIGYCIFQIHTAWGALIIFILSLINLTLFILSKYAAYVPAEESSANNLVVTSIHLCMAIPIVGQFLFPVPLIMCIRAYRKSIRNLNQYLDAYNE